MCHLVQPNVRNSPLNCRILLWFFLHTLLWCIMKRRMLLHCSVATSFPTFKVLLFFLSYFNQYRSYINEFNFELAFESAQFKCLIFFVLTRLFEIVYYFRRKTIWEKLRNKLKEIFLIETI